MGKRRTRKEKSNPLHPFLISWNQSTSEAPVKGQFESTQPEVLAPASHTKKARLLAKDRSLVPVKRDIVKSLLLASLVLASELVIYLAWNFL